jgi:phage repressor protein C with HTH and peptisase S24 domain
MKPHYSAHENVIGARLKIEMRKRGLSSSELARRADVLTSFLYDIISGKSANPSTVKLARVADALGISLHSLVSGEGGSEHAQHSQLPSDCVTIPRITVTASAGGGNVVTREEADEFYYFREQWIRSKLGARVDDLRMLYVSGDSMEPTLCHQDIILVDTSRTLPTPPGVFVLFDGLGLVVKRLEYVAHPEMPRLRIISDNTQYSTYERAIADVKVIGRVVWFAREI